MILSDKTSTQNQPAVGLFVTVLTLVWVATESQVAKLDDYYNLTSHLFSGYRKDVRPFSNVSETPQTDIFVQFHLFSLDINEKDQAMKTNALLDISWGDSYFEWQEKDFADIETIVVTQNMLWLPDIVPSNTVTTQTQLGYDNLQIRIGFQGYLFWRPTAVFETSCVIDVTYYPFDTQICSVEFTTVMYTTEEVNIIISPQEPINIDRFSPNGIWDILNASAKNQDAEENRSRIVFMLQLKRRPTFYVLNIILPVVILAMTSSLVFALPAESGEKMSLSITVLLAFAVYLTLVTDAMPKTSIQVSLLMVYIILLLALTAFSVVLSAFVLKLHHRLADRPLGRKTTKMIILLQKLMCFADNPRQPVEVVVKTSYQNNNVSIVNQCKRQMTKPNAISPCDNSQESDESSCRAECHTTTRRSSEVNHISGQLAAETLSTFLFIAFLIFIVVRTIIFFVVLFVGGATQQENTRLT